MPDWKSIARNAGEGLAAMGRDIGEVAQAAAAAARAPTHVCTSCGYVGKPKWEPKQNGCFAVVLLLCFIIPGILYIIFTSKKYPRCPKCNRWDTMIPVDSPQGRALSGATPPAARREERACPYCAEPILVEARVCKHCGRDVVPLI